MLLPFFVYVSLLTLIYAVYRLLSDRTGILGPIVGRLSSLYRIWILLDGHGPINYFNLHKKYGPVVRTGPNHVSLSDSSLIPVIYDTKNHFLKSAFYDLFRPLYRGKPLDTVFTTQDVAQNRRLKAPLVKNMTGSPSLFKDEIQHSIDVFAKQMRSIQGQSIDMSYWAFFWAFDVTFALVFGCHYGYMESQSDCNRWIYTFKTITSGAAMLGQVPEWCSWTLANDAFMTFMRRFQSFPDPTQEFITEIERRIKDHDSQKHECGKTFICDTQHALKSRRSRRTS